MKKPLFHHPLKSALAGVAALVLTACGGGADAGDSFAPVAQSRALALDDADAELDADTAGGATASQDLLAADDGAGQSELR
jgi:hypothetical protein